MLTLADYAASGSSTGISSRAQNRIQACFAAISPVAGAIPLSRGQSRSSSILVFGSRTGSGAPELHAYGLLHAICATAVKDGLLQANPCQIDG